MQRALIVMLLGLLLSSDSQARQDSVIYRCEHDGVIEFSDQPCQTHSGSEAALQDQIHRSNGSISVISPANDLDEIKQASRAWMDDYRERQLERASAMAETRRVHSSTPTQARTILKPIVWPYRPPPYLNRPNRTDPAEITRRQQPYSALSGRFPGTRPRGVRPDDPQR